MRFKAYFTVWTANVNSFLLKEMTKKPRVMQMKFIILHKKAARGLL